MGWKGTVRSIGAAVRAAERDAKRRQRELERQEAHYAKMQDLEQAAYEVDVYENHLDVIQSIHKECSPPIDWNQIFLSERPQEPQKTNNNEAKAQSLLYSYKPGLIDRLFKREQKKRQILSKKLVEAIKSDELEYSDKISNWKKKNQEWDESVTMAASLLDGKAETKIEAINDLQPFSEIANLGSSLSVTVHDNGILEATINVHASEIKSLLKSGKLSIKKMPKGKFNEIYQDYVCSCILRIANELFAALPDNLVLVTALDELLNTQTGHLEESPILSVALSRSTLAHLNLEAIDPSDSMSNFKHNMLFKKTQGFHLVERISPDGLSYK